MAPISKFIAFLFLTTLSLSLQTNARDSQFFSKVTYNNNNNVKEVPQKEEPLNKPEQQPVFMPENGNSYGLYGHESGLHPPMDTNADPYTTTYKPYKTTTDQEDTNNNNFYNFQKDADTTKYPNEISDTRLTGTSFNNNKKESYDTKFTGERFNSMENQNDNKFNYNNKDAYDTKFTGERFKSMGNQNDNKYNYNNNRDAYDTKFTGEGYNSMENQNNKYNYNNNVANEKYYFNNDNAPNDRYSFKNKAATNNYNGERLGMSDTRAMEGGKYFYNVNSEKYNPTTTYEGSSKGVNSENWSNNKGYFGNNNNVNKNSLEGYQNQEEFENDQEEFEP